MSEFHTTFGEWLAGAKNVEDLEKDFGTHTGRKVEQHDTSWFHGRKGDSLGRRSGEAEEVRRQFYDFFSERECAQAIVGKGHSEHIPGPQNSPSTWLFWARYQIWPRTWMAPYGMRLFLHFYVLISSITAYLRHQALPHVVLEMWVSQMDPPL